MKRTVGTALAVVATVLGLMGSVSLLAAQPDSAVSGNRVLFLSIGGEQLSVSLPTEADGPKTDYS